MKRTMRFSVGGQTVDVPEDELNDFNAAAQEHGVTPDEIRKYRVGDKDVDVPQSQYDQFAAIAKERGAQVTPLRTVSMDDGTSVSMTEKDIEDFAYNAANGFRISRKDMERAGVPQMLVRSAADRAKFGTELAQIFHPEFIEYGLGPAKETPKQNLGVWETLRQQKQNELGKEIGDAELTATLLPGIGTIMSSAERGKESNEQRLYFGNYADPLEASRLALAIGIPQETVAQINAKASAGQMPRRPFGGLDSDQYDMKVLGDEYKKLMNEALKERIIARQNAGEQLSQNELSWLQNAAVGAVGAGAAIAEMANPVVASATLGASAMNRAARMANGPLELDENGNVRREAVRDQYGNVVTREDGSIVEKHGTDKDTAMLKGFAGAAAERVIWSGATAKAFKAIPGGAKVADKIERGGFLKRNAGELAGMVAKTRLTELADDVVGLNVADGESGESFGDWLAKTANPVETVKTALELLPVHGAMKAFGKIKNYVSKDAREHMANVKKAREDIDKAIGEGKSKNLTDAEVLKLHELSTSDGLTQEKIDSFVSKVGKDADASEELFSAAADFAKQMRGSGFRMSNEASDSLASDIVQQVGTERAKEVFDKAKVKFKNPKDLEDPELREKAIIEAANEVFGEQGNDGVRRIANADKGTQAEVTAQNRYMRTPTRVGEKEIAEDQEARAKRAAEKKRGVAKEKLTPLPEKPTPPELRVEERKKPVIEADLSDLSKKTAQVGKGTGENAEIGATKARNAAENLSPREKEDYESRYAKEKADFDAKKPERERKLADVNARIEENDREIEDLKKSFKGTDEELLKSDRWNELTTKFGELLKEKSSIEGELKEPETPHDRNVRENKADIAYVKDHISYLKQLKKNALKKGESAAVYDKDIAKYESFLKTLKGDADARVTIKAIPIEPKPAKVPDGRGRMVEKKIETAKDILESLKRIASDENVLPKVSDEKLIETLNDERAKDPKYADMIGKVKDELEKRGKLPQPPQTRENAPSRAPRETKPMSRPEAAKPVETAEASAKPKELPTDNMGVPVGNVGDSIELENGMTAELVTRKNGSKKWKITRGKRWTTDGGKTWHDGLKPGDRFKDEEYDTDKVPANAYFGNQKSESGIWEVDYVRRDGSYELKPVPISDENAPSRAPQGKGITSRPEGAERTEGRNDANGAASKPKTYEEIAKRLDELTEAAKPKNGKKGDVIAGNRAEGYKAVAFALGYDYSPKKRILKSQLEQIAKELRANEQHLDGRNSEMNKLYDARREGILEAVKDAGLEVYTDENGLTQVRKAKNVKSPSPRVPDGKGRMVKKAAETKAQAASSAAKRAAATPGELKPLKDAIAEAKKSLADKKGAGTMVADKQFSVSVGTMEIKFGNTAEGIARAEKIAKKLSVVKDWMPKEPSNKPPSAPKPLKVARGKDIGTFDDVAPDFLADKKDWHKEWKAPFVKDGYVYATDGRTIIRMKADVSAKNTEGAPDGKKIFDAHVGNPVEKFKIDASAESVPLEQARAATNKDYKGVEIWRSPDGKIVMRSRTAEDTRESNSAFMNAPSLKGHDYLGTFDPDYIEKAFKTFAKLGVKDVNVEWSGATKPLYIHGGGAEVLIMPLRIGENGVLSADTKVQLLGGRRRMTDAQRAEAVNRQIADEIALAKEKNPKITQKQILEIEDRIREAEKKAQEEIGKHKGNLDPMLSPDKPLGERIVDSAAELDRLIAEEESAAPSGSSAEGLPSRSYSWKSGSGVGGLFPRLVSKNSIVRKMKELFPEFAIRGENTTKIGASYAGHFEPWRELIRSKDMASIDTIPHEIGHGISMRTKRKAMNIPQEAKRELAKFGRQLYGNKKPKGGYMEEGFAEYVRGYMTGAENLAAEAPALDKWFNESFAKVNPEYVEKMRQIRLEVQRYRQQSDMQKVAAFMKPDSGLVSRALEAVKSLFSAENWNDTNATLTRGIKNSGMSRMFEWRQEFRDLEKAIKEGRTADADALRKSIDEKIASDPRIFASNSRGTSKSRVMDAFENGVTDIEGLGKIGNVVGWNNDGTPIRDNNTESVRDIFKSFSRKELADWDKYAIAKVGLENYINEGREFGLGRSVCENIVRDLESPKLEDALKRFSDFTRRGVSVGLESGAISKSEYEAITGAHKYYVRIERRLAPDGAGLGGAQQNPFHKIKGSSKNILNPRAATMIQMERQIRFFQAAKLLNLIGKATLRAEKANADFAKGVGNEEYQVAANMPLRVANAQEAVNFTSEKLKEDFKKRAAQAFEDNGQAQPGAMTTRRGKLMTEAQSMALDLYDSMYGEDGSKLTIFREKPSNGKNGLVSTYIDGKLVTFELPDAKWSKFFTGMEDDAIFNSKGAQTAWKIATAPSRTLKLGATLINTAFTTANLTRDTQHAAVTSESRQIPVVNIAQGLYDILYSKKTSALFKQMGGEAALFAGSSKERQYENAARMASANTLFKKVGASLYNPIHATTGAISSVLSVPEMAPRVREMAGVMKKAQDAGLSYETAARLGFAAAKEVSLDYGKYGRYMRYLNDIVPYTSAWYRGLEQLSRKFGITEELPTSFEERRGVKAMNTVGKGLLFLTLPAIATTIAKMAMSDDEEREAIFKKTPREKWDFDDSLGVRLAQPFELGSIFHAMPKAMVYEAYGDKGAVKEALWHGIESNIIRYKDPVDFARGMSLISPWLEIAMNEKWDGSPIVSPFIKGNMPKSQWKDYSTTGVASWIGEKMDWAPAYIDHVSNSYSGGMWKRWLSPAADNSLMTLTGLSTFRPRATARRDVNEFYEFAEDTRRKYNGGKASPEEVGRLLRAEKLKDELSEDFKEARNLNNAGLSTDERNKRREEIMFRVFRKIRDWDKAEVSDRDIGIRKAVDAISAKEIQKAEKSTLDKNFSVIKGISLGELEYQLREHGREYIPDGKGKMRPRWTKDTIRKRVRNLYNAIQLMD